MSAPQHRRDEPPTGLAASAIACGSAGTNGFVVRRSIWLEAVRLERSAGLIYPAGQERRRLDNPVQAMDGRTRPYTEVTAR